MQEELAVGVTEVMLLLWSSPAFHFLFVGYVICRLFGWDLQKLGINASRLRTPGFPFCVASQILVFSALTWCSTELFCSCLWKAFSVSNMHKSIGENAMHCQGC